MPFDVVPEDLETLADRLATRATDAASAADYASTHVTSSGVFEGIFAQVSGVIDDIAAQLGPSLTTQQDLSRTSAAEVDKAALHYRGTDTATEARLDSTY